MEEVKAEKSIWHKTCFRCIQCSKPLRWVMKFFHMFFLCFYKNICFHLLSRRKNKIKNETYMHNLYSVDTFESHEGVLYCKLHFKSLFSPKAVEDSEAGNRKKK